MITLLTGPWNNIPKTYDSVEDYLQKVDPSLFVDFTNEMIDKYFPGKEHFVLGAEEQKFIADYVAKHENELFPREKNTYDYQRFNNLIDDAITHILQNRGYM